MTFYQRMGAHLWDKKLTNYQFVAVHSTESDRAMPAINWMESQQNGSYHNLVDVNGDEWQLVPYDRQAWAAMSMGNARGLHICAAGRAAWPRSRWLGNSAQVSTLAKRIAYFSQMYGIPIVRLSPADVRAGKRGVCTHADISAAFRESDHTDPGGNYPMDALLRQATNQGGLSMGDVDAINKFTADFNGPIGSDVKDVRQQLTGGRDKGQYPGWPQLGNRTLVDAIAALCAKAGVEGCYDPATKK